MKSKKRLVDAIVFVVLALVSITFIMPFLWVLLTSVKPDTEIYSAVFAILPKQPTTYHYEHVFSQMRDFFSYFRNTILITLWSVALTVVLSTTVAYSFSKYQYRGRGLFLTFVLLTLTLPYVIYLIPVYIMEFKVDLVDTRWGLILPYIAVNMPMAVFIMRGQFNNIPKEMSEAASIDGASHLQVFLRIMLPIVKSGIATIIILTFITVWGEFTFARTLASTVNSLPLSVGIAFLRDEAASWQYGTLSATITMTLIPLLAIFLSMQKYFVKGVMEGALKG